MTTRAIKICGLKTPEAIAAALDGGATHLGFIFFDKSPRALTPREAGRLAVPARGRAKLVAVTVDADDALLADIMNQLRPDILQLHGKESPERANAIRERFGVAIWKAVSVREAADLDSAKTWAGIADRLLLDAKPPRGAILPGGNGIAFDWTLLEGLDREVNYILSGGLDVENVADAIRLVDPAGLDVSSGVESSPGVKDLSLIKAFLAQVDLADTKDRTNGAYRISEEV